MPDDANTAEQPTVPFWRWALWWFFKRAVFWYVVICVLLYLFQRRLIYVPSRAEKITVKDSGLANGTIGDVSFPTEDGLTLRAWHALPFGTAASTGEAFAKHLADGRPVVLFFHGNGGDRRGRIPYARLMTNAGAHVLLIDYRGYGDNPGAPSETGLHRDALAAWNYAVKTCGVKPANIVIFGESLGGGPAVKLAQVQCDAGTPPGGLYLRSTFSSLKAAASHHYSWLPVRALLMDQFRSDESIPKVTCPIAMIHGTADRIVPFQLGEALFQAAPKQSSNGIKKRLTRLVGVGHNNVLFNSAAILERDLKQFLSDVAKN